MAPKKPNGIPDCFLGNFQKAGVMGPLSGLTGLVRASLSSTFYFWQQFGGLLLLRAIGMYVPGKAGSHVSLSLCVEKRRTNRSKCLTVRRDRHSGTEGQGPRTLTPKKIPNQLEVPSLHPLSTDPFCSTPQQQAYWTSPESMRIIMYGVCTPFHASRSAKAISLRGTTYASAKPPGPCFRCNMAVFPSRKMSDYVRKGDSEFC